MSGKIRIVLIEAEGDEAVIHALKAFTHQLQGDALPPAIVEKLQPAVPPVRAIDGEAISHAVATHRNGRNGSRQAKKPAASSAEVPEAAIERTPAAGTLEAKITPLLQKQPLSSKEVYEKLGGTKGGVVIGSVYDALHRMRKAGLVESRSDEADGQRKNYLIGGGALVGRRCRPTGLSVFTARMRDWKGIAA